MKESGGNLDIKGEKNPITGNIIHVTVNNYMQPYPLKSNAKQKAKEVVIPDKNMISNLLSLSRHFNDKRKGGGIAAKSGSHVKMIL